KLCLIWRTYFVCLANSSRVCHGVLQYHATKQSIGSYLKEFGCSVVGPIFEQPNFVPNSKPIVCTYHGRGSNDSLLNPKYRVCGVFGDPHLRTFGQQFETCGILGAWPMVDNEHYTVQITAEGHRGGSIVTKATVMIKKDEECASPHHYLLYQATSNDLPPTFEDGSTSAGPQDSVKLTHVQSGRHVTITLRHLDVTISIRKILNTVSVFIRTHDDFVQHAGIGNRESVQLCSVGCPGSLRIDLTSPEKLSSKKSSPSLYQKSSSSSSPTTTVTFNASLYICKSRHPLLRGYFLESCVHDVMKSGDPEMTVVSYVAMNE
ncbi:hypothetical protein HELRODRAFT_140151, partial [Helobdella robusta]|uniref:Repulsive guidance molecule N-terminal domain-containing protein n=1 Tax=Helobdella robusta TaxID=6412 RepID=T1EJ00_HELRO